MAKEIVHLFQALAVTNACWYSVHHVADDIPSLQELLHTSEQEVSRILHLGGIAKQTKAGFHQRISNWQEIKELKQLSYPEDQLAIITFSIKEACYKATSKLTPSFSYQN